MAHYGIMIDYEWCTGCHSCEVACKQRFSLSEGRFGIKLAHEKPWHVEGEKWEYKFVPIPTEICDMCVDRLEVGKMPSCVQNCCAHVLEYGTLEELAELLKTKGPKTAIFIP